MLVWDAMCPVTFAPSYKARVTSGAGTVAKQAEDLKKAKYSGIQPPLRYMTVETWVVLGPESLYICEGVREKCFMPREKKLAVLLFK